MRAETQTWNGPVSSGSGSSDGGEVRLSGAIDGQVRPLLSLAAGADFTLLPPGPGRRRPRPTLPRCR